MRSREQTDKCVLSNHSQIKQLPAKAQTLLSAQDMQIQFVLICHVYLFKQILQLAVHFMIQCHVARNRAHLTCD